MCRACLNDALTGITVKHPGKVLMSKELMSKDRKPDDHFGFITASKTGIKNGHQKRASKTVCGKYVVNWFAT